ncbi:hypothetical protein N7474_005870 [Penicillium riverlandense]|uniref:uncharacterized protein n=1 Tax=Penicillium riverlandense TaxID=1903569 RepID=UPI0025468A65|nr:uncharacterized protein N7474_005870 [Penicillium riverlandense]KAJ5820279.1 hypothetical protein N7474_005870 [Penicillium riverlandense]
MSEGIVFKMQLARILQLNIPNKFFLNHKPTMSYKNNYELHVSVPMAPLPYAALADQLPQNRSSLYGRRSPPPDELLAPLATLYPHVAAMQPRYNSNGCTFTGYRHTGYWASAYTTQGLDDQLLSARKDGARCCLRHIRLVC